MLVIIDRLSADPANTLLRVYECIGNGKNMGAAICDIYEEDLWELLPNEPADPDKIIYRVEKEKMLQLAHRIFR